MQKHAQRRATRNIRWPALRFTGLLALLIAAPIAQGSAKPEANREAGGAIPHFVAFDARIFDVAAGGFAGRWTDLPAVSFALGNAINLVEDAIFSGAIPGPVPTPWEHASVSIRDTHDNLIYLSGNVITGWTLQADGDLEITPTPTNVFDRVVAMGVYTTSRETVVQIFTESGDLLREVPLPGELAAAELYFIGVISPVERIGRIVIKDPLPGSSLIGGMVSRVVSLYD